MSLHFLVAVFVGILWSPCFAANIDPRQTSAPQQQSPVERALLQKLNVETNNSLQCAASGFILQDQLSVAQARVKALEEKYEPKKPDEPKKTDE